jgi:hypothetical protein
MNELTIAPNWSHYLEIPERSSTPVKLERILTERMKAFRNTRRVTPFNKTGATHV